MNPIIAPFINPLNELFVYQPEIRLGFQRQRRETFLDPEAIETVMNESSCSREVAIYYLNLHNGDPVEALLEMDSNDNNIIYYEENNIENISNDDIYQVIRETNCTREKAIFEIKNNRGHVFHAVESISRPDKYKKRKKPN